MKRKMFAVKLRKKFSRNGGLGDWDGVMSRTILKGLNSSLPTRGYVLGEHLIVSITLTSHFPTGPSRCVFWMSHECILWKIMTTTGITNA